MTPEATDRRAWLRDPVSGERFGLHLAPDGRLLANPRLGEGPAVVVMSIPKAGTYLLGLLLEKLGFVDTELHLSDFSLTDYRGLTIEQKRSPDYRDYAIPVRVSAGLIGEGQFAVGHLKPEPWGRESLAGLKRIFLKRDLVDATFSHLRFFVETGRGPVEAPWRALPPGPAQALAFVSHMGPELFRHEYAPMADWAGSEDLLELSFEELQGDAGPAAATEAVARLCRFLGRESGGVTALLQREVLGRPTKTLSGERTDVALYWDEAVRDAFLALGLNALNTRLGYAPR